ncbi:hypothetical protein [Micromonospora sp. NBC_00421]|uniref:hypothetical protein n=1 Tax=Micromonospora sp. NBC_00421 TaxID=2975976 RepID=UPI002E1CB100
MPTEAQLKAEPYWGREFVTPEVDWLGDELCRRTGRPRVAFGSKGDNAHLRGAHRSQEWIKRSRYCTNRTYTVQSGLTVEQERHIAGVDFTPGSAAAMIAQCKRILAAMKAGKLDEVREFYGNVDGDQVVDGWDNVRDQAASSDSSHLWHWHLSLDRRHCRNRQLMERILAIALGTPEEAPDMTPEQGKQLDRIETMLKRPDGREAVGALYQRTTRGYDDNGVKATHPSLTSLGTQLATMQAALLGAIKGLDTPAILARIDAVATEERKRDAQAAAERAELAAQLDGLEDLVRRMESGELTAEQVLTALRDLLPAAPAQG